MAATPGFAAGASAGAMAESVDAFATAVTTNAAANLSAEADGGSPLPDMVAYLPVSRPGGSAAETEAALEASAMEQPAATAEGDAAPADQTTVTTAALASNADASEDVAKTASVPTKKAEFFLTSGDPAVFDKPAIEPKKKSFLSSFFGASSNQAQAAPLIPQTTQKPKPVVQLASIDPTVRQPAVRATFDPGDNGLPGVRQTALFEIKRKSGIDDDSDVDLHEDEVEPIQLASAAGMARLAPNGLLKQRESVDVACLKPSLVRMLKTIEAHYGRKIVVTSGYRSPTYNRQVRGAKNSMHMYCAAADIQIAGVGKWELAKYVRAMPGRGGVGTYCHTESVHVDVGPERDWNWRCRRRT